jgi:hypothetical protein
MLKKAFIGDAERRGLLAGGGRDIQIFKMHILHGTTFYRRWRDAAGK